MAKCFQLSYAPPMAVIVVVVLLMAIPSISAVIKNSSVKAAMLPHILICETPWFQWFLPAELSKILFKWLSLLSSSPSYHLRDQPSCLDRWMSRYWMTGLNPSTEVQNLLDVVKDCSSSFKAAVDLKLRAIKQMDGLNNPSSSSDCRVEMSNVKTWLSAALTREEKCTKRLGSLSVYSGENIMKKISEGIVNTAMETKITSNALALAKDFLAHH